MREALCFSTVLVLAAWSATAEVQTQTFPVTVSNAVSGKLETVPLTFRFGATNALVERFDGARFVPVPVKSERPFLYDEQFARGRARLAFLRRLEAILLPEIRLPEMTLSNAVEVLAEKVRRADRSTNEPVRIIYRDRKNPKTDRQPRIPSVVIPATNALAALKLEDFIERLRPQPEPVRDERAGDPFAAGFASNRDWTNYPVVATRTIDRGVLIKVYDEWLDSDVLTRSYAVPFAFFSRFPDAQTFQRYAAAKSGLREEAFQCVLMPLIGKVRVTYFDTYATTLFYDEYDRFAFYLEERVLASLFAEWLQPASWRALPIKRDNNSMLLFRGSRGCFLDYYRYGVEKDGSGVCRDGLFSCLSFGAELEEELVSMPQVFSVTVDSGQRHRPEEREECWTYITSSGEIFRLEDDHFVGISVDPDPTTLVVAENPTYLHEVLLARDKVIVPEFTSSKGRHITNCIAQVQTAIDKARAPISRIKITCDAERVSSENPSEVMAPHFCATSISACDALKLLTNFTGLHLMSTAPETVQLVADNINT